MSFVLNKPKLAFFARNPSVKIVFFFIVAKMISVFDMVEFKVDYLRTNANIWNGYAVMWGVKVAFGNSN